MTLLQMSIMGGVLILLTAALRKLAGNRLSAGCYLVLWLAIGLRMLIPISVVSPFSVYGLFQVAAIQNPTIMPIPVTNPRVQWIDNTVQMPISDIVIPFHWITLLWLIGAIGVFLWIVVQHYHSRKIYNTSLPVETAFVLQWQREHTLYRHYQIRQSRQIDTPLTYGVICPIILLPAEGDIDDTALHMKLLHEWNHIRHWDVLWQWVLAILCSVYWFHPAVWLMYDLCRRDMELFCDSATMKRLPGNRRKEYALLLLKQAGTAKQMPLFSQFCLDGYHRMEERVKHIMTQKSSSWKTVLVTVGLLCAGGLVFATSASGEVNHAQQWISIDSPEVQAEQNLSAMLWPVASDDAILTLSYGVRVHPVTKAEMTIDHICIGGVEKGTDIIAAASGSVKEVGFDSKRGNYLIVQCGDNLETQYWHCDEVLAAEGDKVSVGQKIAMLGQTGDATGPCLSFAVYQNGEACDPMNWLK